MSVGLKETHYVMAIRGYLGDEIKVDKYEFSDDDEAFKDNYDDFVEYVDDQIEDALAVYQQGFCSTMSIPEEQLIQLVEKLKAQQNAK